MTKGSEITAQDSADASLTERPSKTERYGDLPQRLSEAWRTYKSQAHKMDLSPDIAMVDAICQRYQDRLKAFEELNTPISHKDEKELHDAIIQAITLRAKLVETEDKLLTKTKQFYSKVEVMLLAQAFIMAINEEDADVRGRIQTRLRESHIGRFLADPQPEGQ